MSHDQEVTSSTGNVFEDLDLPEADTALAKAKLAAGISRIIEDRHLTQTEAAELLGVDQPKISALARGRLSGFSTERLLRFLNALGQDVDIVIRNGGRASAPGKLRVVTR